MKVVIAGAGIGGLTLAAALHREGHEAHVFERAPVLAPIGAGLTIQINAMRALAHYGFERAVAAAGRVNDLALVLDWKGRQLTRASMAEQAARFGQPMVCAHRARLHEALCGLLGEGQLTLGRSVERFEEGPQGVRVTLDDGSTHEAELLVGADGLHSRVRAQLLGDAPVRYAGYTSWRGVCSTAGLPPLEAMSESWGPGARFGLVPIGFDELYWFATANVPAGGRDGAQPDELLARFADWHAPIPQVLRATAPHRLLRTDISDRPPVRKWTGARVALMGDAAHPMTPNLGQGACQAIEDAVVLATLLGKGRALPQVLADYERRRVARANGLVTQAWRFGKLGQLERRPVRAARDALVTFLGKRFGAAGFDALYDFTP